jgi:hypothetical protein
MQEHARTSGFVAVNVTLFDCYTVHDIASISGGKHHTKLCRRFPFPVGCKASADVPPANKQRGWILGKAGLDLQWGKGVVCPACALLLGSDVSLWRGREGSRLLGCDPKEGYGCGVVYQAMAVNARPWQSYMGLQFSGPRRYTENLRPPDLLQPIRQIPPANGPCLGPGRCCVGPSLLMAGMGSHPSGQLCP